MLSRLVIACTVRTHRRLLSSGTVKIAGQKRAVACPQLGNGDALDSGPAKSPLELRADVSRESVVGGVECGSSR